MWFGVCGGRPVSQKIQVLLESDWRSTGQVRGADMHAVLYLYPLPFGLFLCLQEKMHDVNDRIKII